MSCIRRYLFKSLQTILPHHGLSTLAYHITRARWLKRWLIPLFVRHFTIDLSSAVHSDMLAYEHLDALFTRTLKPEARIIAEAPVVSPVDGTISEIGRLTANRILQAKNSDYDVVTLLGGSAALAAPFIDGNFITVYLAPHNYHRVHMPVTGNLQKMLYVPGRIFSVNTTSVAAIPQLFTRNERMISIFNTEHGPLAVIMVGAMLVSGIETAWHPGIVRNQRRGQIQTWDYAEKNIMLQQGQALGCFHFGSTVILLMSKNAPTWLSHWQAGASIQMGSALTGGEYEGVNGKDLAH